MPRTLTLLAFIVLWTAAACSTNPPPETVTPTPSETPDAATARDLVGGVGTITFFDLEGGFYGLVHRDAVDEAGCGVVVGSAFDLCQWRLGGLSRLPSPKSVSKA